MTPEHKVGDTIFIVNYDSNKRQVVILKKRIYSITLYEEAVIYRISPHSDSFLESQLYLTPENCASEITKQALENYYHNNKKEETKS